MSREKVVSSKAVFDGRAVKLRVDTVRLPDGRKATREVVEHPPAVAIVAVDNKDNVLLVEQFRQSIGRDLLEIPAGGIEPGEDPEEAVRREMREETGFLPRKLEKLGGFYAAPGYCTEFLHLYLASDLIPSPLVAEDTGGIVLKKVPISLIPGILRSNICDAKSIAGLFTFLQYRKGHIVGELHQYLEKAEKVPISSIPTEVKEDRYQYLRELLSSLKEGEAIEFSAPNSKVAHGLSSRWRQLAIGRQPHARELKQDDGSYLVYVWLGGTVLDEILKRKPGRMGLHRLQR